MNYLCLLLFLFGIFASNPLNVARYASAGLKPNLLENSLRAIQSLFLEPTL